MLSYSCDMEMILQLLTSRSHENILDILHRLCATVCCAAVEKQPANWFVSQGCLLGYKPC